MIESIELTNWKTHGSTRLEFSKGTNILIGQMGSGKSSIMDAISYALFGTFPAIQHRRSSVNNLIRNKPEQQSSAMVRLSFMMNNDSYTIERDLSLNGPSSAKLEKNGAYVQSQSQRVNEEVEKLLKVDYDLFSKAIYSEQNDLEYFLNLRSSDRKKQIDQLLGLDKFSNAYENATSLINKIKDIVSENEKTTEEFDIKKANSELEDKQREAEEIRKNIKSVGEKLEALEQKRGSMEDRLKEMKSGNAKKTQLKNELTELRSRSATLLIEIEKIEAQKLGKRYEVESQIESLTKKLNDANSKDKETADAEKEAGRKAAREEAELSTINTSIEEKKRLTNELSQRSKKDSESKLSGLTKELDESNKLLAQHEHAMHEGAKQLKELKEHLGKCPVCERELSEELRQRLMDDKQKAVHSAELEATRLGKTIKETIAQIAKTNEAINKLSVIEEKLSGLGDIEDKAEKCRKRFSEAKERVDAVRKQRKELSDAMQQLQAGLSKAKSSKETLERMERYVLEWDKAGKAIESKTREFEGIRVDENAIEKIQNEFTEISSEISRHKAGVDADSRFLKDKLKQIDDKKSDIARINRLYDDVKRKKAAIEDLTRFKNALQETQAILRTKLIDSINSVMHNIWPVLYPYGDYLSVNLHATETDYILKVATQTNRGTVMEDVDAIASGGEKSTACLTMRIAFALVLVPNLKWIILDEPTHNIDQQGINKFVQLFNETLPKIIDQIFIITHDETLKEASNAKIYLLNRDKDRNSATVAVEL